MSRQREGLQRVTYVDFPERDWYTNAIGDAKDYSASRML
jgi:hypothetical protein